MGVVWMELGILRMPPPTSQPALATGAFPSHRMAVDFARGRTRTLLPLLASGSYSSTRVGLYAGPGCAPSHRWFAVSHERGWIAYVDQAIWHRLNRAKPFSGLPRW